MEQSTNDQIWNRSEYRKNRRAEKRRRKIVNAALEMVKAWGGESLVLGLSGGLLASVIGAGIAARLSIIGIIDATAFFFLPMLVVPPLWQH